MTRLINGLHRHAARERCVADQCDDVMIFVFAVARDCHSERGRKGSRGVAGAECVVLRFVTTQETADAAVLLHGRQKIASPGQDFVRVRLMTDVPNQPILRSVERVVHRYG
jgi:hypothetical protein